MPRELISFTNFDQRLWISGGREQGPSGSLRRAMGVAPELTGSIRSRLGSVLLYGINASNLTRFAGHRYAYDGNLLYQDGVSIKGGFTGAPLTFTEMPPQVGLNDALFVCGGGLPPFKIGKNGVISNWGIAAPRDGMQGLAGPADLLTIDSFVSSAANWMPNTCTVTNNTTIPPFGGAVSCLGIVPSDTQATQFSILRVYGSPLNLAYYGDGRSSLVSDIISFRFWISDATKLVSLSLQFDIFDQSFTQYLYANIQLVPGAASPAGTADVQVTAQVDGGRWCLIQIPKSSFVRQGSLLNYDWNTVQAIRFVGALPFGGVGAYTIGLQSLMMTGSYALGTGSLALSGGATYLGQVTFGNDFTGSDSNPNTQPAIVQGVAGGPINWRKIPISTDVQVTNRKLWRSTALQPGSVSAPLFYVDTIHDNTTTTYKDVYGDTATPFTSTVWFGSATYILNQLIDGGNGWLFKCTTPGTSGATTPLWNAPGGYWIGLFSNFVIGDTIFDPSSGFVMQCTAQGQTGKNLPAFGGLSVGGTITDGTVVWQRIAAPTTADNTIVWTFAGINSAPVLSNQQVLLDNAPPLPTIASAVGPWQGSMITLQPGLNGNIYISPPGRPESVGVQVRVTGTDDQTAWAVIWDTCLWIATFKKIFQIVGTYPVFSVNEVNTNAGTNKTTAVVPVHKVGIVYAAQDGIRVFNYSGIQFIGFDSIAPILVGDLLAENAIPPVIAGAPLVENLPGFLPFVAFEAPFGEVIFSDTLNQLSLALSLEQLQSGVMKWRQPGPVFTAGYYERDTGKLITSFNRGVYDYETAAALYGTTLAGDGGQPYQFQIQSPGALPSISAQGTSQRFYITAQLNGQTLTPVVIVDGVEYTLPVLVGTARKRFELPKQISGFLFDGIRLTGMLTARVEIFRMEAEIWYGETSAYERALEKASEKELSSGM